MANNRLGRINEEVMREIATLIPTLKDPRIHIMTSITRADVTPDMRYARLFISVLGDESALKESIKGLKSAAGYLRRELSRKLQLRYTPELVFVADDSITHGVHIMELIGSVSDKNQESENGADEE